MNVDIRPGDLWWDKESKWSSAGVNMVYLMLGTVTESGGPETWTVAEFMWSCDGYCGSPIRKMTEDEIAVLTFVGNITAIKSFL